MADRSVIWRLIARDEASKAFQQVDRSAGKTESAIGKFGGVAMKAGAVAVSAFGAAAVGGVAMGLKTAASLQQAQIGFETLIGSAKGAEDFVGKLSKFAANTPFEMPGLVDSARTLMGVGVAADNVIPILTDFGDAAGALGIQQDAFQRIMLATSQAISAGKFQAGDLNQIMNNGLPIWSLLSKAMGKPVTEIRKLASEGKLLSKDVLPVLQAQMHKDYGGAMAKQSQTLSGLWSTFMDTLNLGMAKAIMPLVPVLQQILPGAMGAMGEGLGKLSAGVAWLVGKLQGNGAAFKALGDRAKPLIDWIKRDLIPTFQRVGGGVLASVRGSMMRLGQAVRDHRDAIEKLGRVFRVVGLFLTEVWLPVLGELVKFIAWRLVPEFRMIATVFEKVVFPAFKMLAQVALMNLGIVIDAAANAFGWVPGLGPKLKSAQKAFHKFADDVNDALNGIHDRNVNVYVRTKSGVLDTRTDAIKAGSRRAMGGPVVAGQSYLVGENGPEVVTFGSSGYVTPNHRLRGGGGDTYVVNGFVGSPAQLRAALADATKRGAAVGNRVKFA